MKHLTGAALAALILTGGQAMAEADKFDPAGWAAVAGKPDQSGDRHDMLTAAIAEIPVGTPAADVIARLGEPDRRVDQGWAYLAGSTIFGGEYRALLVAFDAQGRVASAREVSTESWQ